MIVLLFFTGKMIGLISEWLWTTVTAAQTSVARIAIRTSITGIVAGSKTTWGWTGGTTPEGWVLTEMDR